MTLTEPLLRTAGQAPLVIAHRGASARQPENTLRSFLAAWRDGATWVETDVQPTADGELILLHDDTVDRTTSGVGPVQSLTAAELAALDAGSWFASAQSDARIPRAVELLALLTGDRKVFLEIKGPHTRDDLRHLIDAIDRAGVWNHVFLQSFSVPILRMLRELLPDEPIGLLVEEVGDDPVAECRAVDAMSYNPDVRDLLHHEEIVARLHDAGLATVPWVANDESQWGRLTDLGVDGMFTDDPGALLDWQGRRATTR